MKSPDHRNSRPGENRLAALVLAAALGFFGWAVARGWNSGSLPGNEFRQAQTALAAHFINADSDFSLAYPTPLLGKPWSIPMEFPLYQWSVVGLARLTGIPPTQAGRAVSIACLLLALPALNGLLRRLRLPRASRRYTLALTLLCPLHLFYGRAFLIETMALLFSLWFLHAFVTAMRRRSAPWTALAAAAGAAAGLVKVTTLLVYLAPAALWGAFLLRRAWRRHHAPRPVAVLARGLAIAGPVLALSWAWVAFADTVKARNPEAGFLLSGNLTGFNFGRSLFGERFAAATWSALTATWDRGLLPWPAALLLLAALCGAGRWRRPALAAAALFLLIQLACPLLYSIHEYYFMACAVLPFVATGCVLAGLRESRLPRWLAPALALVCLAAQARAWHLHYQPAQQLVGPGGSGLTESLRAYTPPASIIVVAGADWSSVIPYYARRRALMLRNGTEADGAHLDTAFRALASEEIGALVLVGDQRANAALAAKAAAAFNLDPAPTYRHTTADVYLARAYREETLRALRLPVYDQITAAAAPAELAPAETADPDAVSPSRARTSFTMITPAPTRARSRFELGVLEFEGARVLNAHPDSNVWVPPPPAATRIECEFGILPGAYEGTQGQTNGVEFIIDAERPDGDTRELYYRVLTPAEVAADRGVQSASFDYQPRPGETVVFRTRNNGHSAFDWAFWRRIEIR